LVTTKKNLKRNPNYEIEESENPNPKDILLWNRKKLQAIIAYLSTTLESMKHRRNVISLGQNWIRKRREAIRIWA
jgi:hypothetical protein